jgi:hypothetical protein
MDLHAVPYKVPRLARRVLQFGSFSLERDARALFALAAAFNSLGTGSRRSGSRERKKPQRRFEDSKICPMVRYSAWK